MSEKTDILTQLDYYIKTLPVQSADGLTYVFIDLPTAQAAVNELRALRQQVVELERARENQDYEHAEIVESLMCSIWEAERRAGERE